MTLSKILKLAGGSLLALVLHAPPILHRAAGVALWFVIVDSATGFLCARRGSVSTSSAFRAKQRDKMLCYVGFLGFCAGMSVLALSWNWLIYAWWGVAFAEGYSICENLRGLIKDVGPTMAPIAAVLDRALAFLGAQANAAGSAAAGALSGAETNTKESTPDGSQTPEIVGVGSH